jgi:hypothetical protein
MALVQGNIKSCQLPMSTLAAWLLAHLNFAEYWIVRTFPFTLNSRIHYLLHFISSLSFILDFATTRFVLTVEHTERSH